MIRTIILGLDSFDPRMFERLLEQGKLPNLARYAAQGAYSPFSVTDPPQSEVSWTSIATGLNPGGHGLFDFVHRNPENYALHVSLLPTKSGIGGTRFTQPFSSKSIFDQVASDGYPATVLWWPALFPARLDSPVRTIPGLGTPDILGRLGVGASFTTAPVSDSTGAKIPVELLASSGAKRFKGGFAGPARSRRGKSESVTIPFELEIQDDETGSLRFANKSLNLKQGEWSPIIELEFKMGFMFKVRAVTRVILTHINPEVRLYILPLQIHPLKTPWHYATPSKFVKQTWQDAGPFLTLGWPQDTTALEEGHLNDEHFLDLCSSIMEERSRAFLYHIDQYDEGLLACVFDTLDRVQHMFLGQRPDIVESWYVKMDKLVGKVEERIRRQGKWENTRLLILSDHGFERFDYKVHLNRWLLDNGFLFVAENGSPGTFNQIDWAKTKAYAIGLNSIYLNLQGREGKGIVAPADRDAVLNDLAQKLLTWEGPDGKHVVGQALKQEDAFDGPLTEYGPDLLVGFSPGYRASQQTGLGNWESASVEANSDHWYADHCMYAAAVPGVIFTNHNLLKDFTAPSYRDIPAIAIDSEPDQSGSLPPPTSSGGEDEDAVQERLRSLGYL